MRVSTLDMEIAVIDKFNPRQNLIVPNVSWGIYRDDCGVLHECDVLVLSTHGYATEIEIKVSKQDLIKDNDKKHGHIHNLISRLYFAVPVGLKDIALQVIPERAGLFVFDVVRRNVGTMYEFEKHILTMERPCVRNKNGLKWTNDERFQLARLGALRILGLKRKINKLEKEKVHI